MVYMEPVHLGWEPLIDTWSVKFQEENLDKENKVPTYITQIIDRTRSFFQEYFKEMREHLREVIQTVDNNVVNSCINLVNVLM